MGDAEAADLLLDPAIGSGSFAAHYSMTRAMKLADATVVVPIDFIRLPLIAVVGAVLLREPLRSDRDFRRRGGHLRRHYYSLSREARRA